MFFLTLINSWAFSQTSTLIPPSTKYAFLGAGSKFYWNFSEL